MKTSADPVRDYLSAVGREASALPADRRQELLADLAEHIEVTRAERPDAALGQILTELGDPRTIAATALAEAGNGAPGRGGAETGAPVRRGKVHPLVPLLMLTVPFFFATVFPDVTFLSFCSAVFRLIGAVLLCTSVHWATAHKVVGVLITAVLPTVAITVWTETTVAPAGAGPALAANLVTLAVLIGTTGRLWKIRRA
ncbi:HAAS signaling domain-containing protein [Streptomyces uncialis]|uniref:HAAS signaling domain-containing protein n=1 Tax=Streptomyces uncialis TaxID=1048205 RepID=UPI0033C18079